VVQHQSGSLEAAVSRVRRRNLIVSMSILGVLGAAMGMLTLATRRAQDLARRQMEFVATVSHELRTPLAVLRSAADNLADGVVHDEAQARRYGEMMRTEGRRLTVMVEQILEFAGLASGQRVVRQDPVSIGALLREVAETAAPLALQSGVRIELDAPDALPPAAGDEPALRRVFENLVANAVKYGVDGKWVGIRAGVRGEMLEVTVSDRGIGIAAADQARIFEPFYRAPSVVAAQVQGAGLGLSLVQRIVQAHGGTVTVESAEGAGAAFTVRLPIAREPAALSNEHQAVTSGAQSPRLDWS
jgi:signal transduction histidine kinase